MGRFSGWTSKDLAGLNVVVDCGSLADQRPVEEKKNKFGAIKTETGGVKYDSKMEANEAMNLDWKIKTGEIKGYRRQVEIPLIVAGVHVCIYKIDFVVELLSGELEYVEVKGVPTPAWRIKWKLFRALYPNLKVRIVRKQKDPK